jgi:site-specific recombinase XerD
MPNSVKSSISVLRYYVLEAIEDKLIAENPFKDVNVSGNDTNREFLTDKELQRVLEIYKGNMLPDSHKKAMRSFLFSCFCGLRMGDVKQLKEEHIVGNCIVMIVGKTKNTSGMMVKIPITPIMRHLMGEFHPGKPIFELFSEFRMNIMIQEVMELAKIKKHITFYCSRHTFATIFLKNTGNIVMLKNLLGHKKMEQTLVYAHLIREDVEDKMLDTFSDYSF